MPGLRDAASLGRMPRESFERPEAFHAALRYRGMPRGAGLSGIWCDMDASRERGRVEVIGGPIVDPGRWPSSGWRSRYERGRILSDRELTAARLEYILCSRR